jgi:hypothetical protein
MKNSHSTFLSLVLITAGMVAVCALPPSSPWKIAPMMQQQLRAIWVQHRLLPWVIPWAGPLVLWCGNDTEI